MGARRATIRRVGLFKRSEAVRAKKMVKSRLVV
jgi:hypothetical protein